MSVVYLKEYFQSVQWSCTSPGHYRKERKETETKTKTFIRDSPHVIEISAAAAIAGKGVRFSEPHTNEFALIPLHACNTGGAQTSLYAHVQASAAFGHACFASHTEASLIPRHPRPPGKRVSGGLK